MPLYEYACDACDHRFEVILKFSDPPVEVCPKCGGRVRKLLSSPAIQFKGTGWYITDYARKGGDGAKSGESGSGEKASEKTADKADKAPDKADAKPASSEPAPATKDKETAAPAAKDSAKSS